MKIAVYGSRRQHDRSAELRELLAALVLEGARVAVHEKLYDHLSIDLGLSMFGTERVVGCPADADMVLSLGGDGTFLRTVAWTEPYEVPVLGINTGHLGYLTALSLDEAIKDTTAIVKLDFRRESLSMLRVEAPEVVGSALALNEVVVAKEDSASMITANVRLNGAPLAQYKSDGLIVATPTGSTAYNLSVGGPIVQPSAPVMVVSPIAAHSLNLRPLVIADSSVLDVKMEGRGKRFRLVVDGRPTSLPMGASVRILRSDSRVEVLRRRDRDFADILGEKLGFNV